MPVMSVMPAIPPGKIKNLRPEWINKNPAPHGSHSHFDWVAVSPHLKNVAENGEFRENRHFWTVGVYILMCVRAFESVLKHAEGLPVGETSDGP